MVMVDPWLPLDTQSPLLVKDTIKPELAVAPTVKGTSPKVLSAGALNVIVCEAGDTTNRLDVPVSVPPVLVAVMVQDPELMIITGRDARTPFANVGVVREPAVKEPVELISTVDPTPENAVTVLLFASS